MGIDLFADTRRLAFLVLLASLVAGRFCRADHEWRVLDKHTDALAARIELIQEARCDIRLACFTIDSGLVVQTLREQLEARAADGVSVKLLVDGLPSRKSLESLRGCLAHGIEIRVFHPVAILRLDTINRRLHSKLMVIDGHAAILGSRNLTDRHFGLAESSFVDCDVLVRGPICQSIQDYFDNIWYSSSAVPLEQVCSGIVNLTSLNSERKQGKLPIDRLDCDSWQLDCLQNGRLNEDCDGEHWSSGESTQGMADGRNLSLWYDRTLRKSDRAMACQVERLVDSARNSLRIESPYPAFSRSFSAALRRAAKRGVRVSILTNSISSTDQMLTYAAYQNQKAIWLSAGVELYEYNGSEHLHSKTMIVDTCIAWVGSYNFDARSEHYNLELTLQVADPEFVKALSESMSQRQASSTQVGSLRCENFRSSSVQDRVKLRLFQAWMPILRPLL